MAPTAKRARKEPAIPKPDQEQADASSSSAEDSRMDEAEAESSDDDGSVVSSSSTDTDTEIHRAQNTKSKKTLSESWKTLNTHHCLTYVLERKHRATDATPFGRTLELLLATSVPGGAQAGMPLALKPSLSRRKNDEKLEVKAKRVLEVEKKEREEKGHVRDVIEGWNNEDERSLRKVAQRGGMSLLASDRLVQ
jgi:hypothetical protein